MPLETFKEIVDEVLSYGFNDGPQVNRKRIQNWVNEALFEIARQVEAPEFQATEAISLTQGKYKYPLPTGFLRAQDIYYPELQTRLKPVDLQQFDLTAPKVVEGPPAIYTIYASELWVGPTPQASGETLELRFIKNPATLEADADVPALNANYYTLLTEYALGKAFEAEDDLESAQAHAGRFKTGLANYATDVQYRSVDRPRVVDGTWGGGFYGGRV